jgi:hypothetical protein
MRAPPSQFTLAEMIGLVALCGVAFALLRTWAAPLGAGVLVVIPGFVMGCARGGTGIIGGMLSGCLIPMGMAASWVAVEYLYGIRTIRESLDLVPALIPILVACLMWSSLFSAFLYFVDRRWLGASHRDRLAARFIGEGIRFLPGDGEANRLATPFFGQGIRFLSDDGAGIRFLPDDVPIGGERTASTAPSDGEMGR